MSNEDIKQLDLLSVFHYVVGGITALFSCMPFMHVFMGLAIISGKFFKDNNGAAPPSFMGWMFVVMGSVFIVLGWSLAASMMVAGRQLKRHKNRVFCMVVAGIECILMPFGTVLGVFTLVALSKDSVRAVFAPTCANEIPAAQPQA